jgi:hypothetical protein
VKNESLIAAFTESEVRNAVFQMEHNKTPGPDGFPAEFYQVLWGLSKRIFYLSLWIYIGRSWICTAGTLESLR